MKTNDAGRKLIAEFEDVRLEAYLCPAGVWTIGIGATGPGIGPGVVWTEEQVQARFDQDLARCERAVSRFVTVPLSENQFSALVSFVFNLGPGVLITSTLAKKLRNGDVAGAADEFLRWNKARRPDGVMAELAGLTRRRQAERALFLS